MTSRHDKNALSQRLSKLSTEQRAALRLKLEARQRAISPAGATRGPLSFTQFRQWFLDQLEPGNATYNSPIAVRLDGRFDAPAFEAAINRVIEGHEILRTRFARDATGLVQIVEPKLEIRLERAELTLPVELDEALRSAANRAFDLSTLPLVRAHLFQLAPETHVLLVVMHHIISDGWSLGIFVKELVHYYYGGNATRPQVQYLDYVHWEQARFGSASMNEELGWWTAQLRGAPTRPFLPVDHERLAAETHSGATLRLELPRDLLRSIEQTASRHSTTPFVVLLAGFSALLSRWSMATEFLLGTPVANRPVKELEALIGMFVNTVMLRVDLSGNPRHRELIERTKRLVERSLSHQSVPFEKIVEALNPERHQAHDSMFQVMVTYFNEPTRAHLDFPGLEWRHIEFERGFAYRDLTFRMGELQGQFLVDIEYKTQIFERTTIESLARQYPIVLRALVDQPEQALDDLKVDVDSASRRASERRPVWTQVGRRLLEQALGRAPVLVDEASDSVQEMNPVGPAPWPIVFQASSADVDLKTWVGRNRERVRRLLLGHGAILWRGFGVESADELSALVQALGESIIRDYSEPSTPRTQVASGVFTSTEYPADQTINLHNECAYLPKWPARLFFCCETPAARGGATTIGDMRAIYRRIDPHVRAEFARRGVLYARNFHAGVDLSWEEVYGTHDRTRVEELCRLSDTQVIWRKDGGLSTRLRLPAVLRHPETTDPIWFNSAHMFHVAGHRAALRDSLRSLFGELLPRHAYYGDGATIPDHVIEHISEVYRVHTHPVRWRTGDVLLVDNLLTAHGREPFEGKRSIFVMMTEPRTTHDVIGSHAAV